MCTSLAPDTQWQPSDNSVCVDSVDMMVTRNVAPARVDQ